MSSRRSYLLALAGVLAGCSSDGRTSSGEPTSETSATRDRRTAQSTPAETLQSTPEETPEQTPEETPQPLPDETIVTDERAYATARDGAVFAFDLS